MQALIEVIMPVFLVLGFGYVTVWRGLFSGSAVDGLMIFSQNFAIPCLLFRAISGLDLGQTFDLRLLGPFYLGALTCFAVGIFGARLIFRRPWQDSIAIGFCTLFSNSLLLGLPITERAYGAEALGPNYAIIAIHAPFCYVVGLTVMELVRAGRGGPVRAVTSIMRAVFRNALVIGILLGFVVNLGEVRVPGVVSDAVDLMARAALPSALFGLGGVLYHYRPSNDIAMIGFVCAVSLLLHPAIVWVLAHTVGLSTGGLRSAVMTAAMAPGINTYIFANLYGVARQVAASAVLVATAASFVTIWFWLSVLP